MQQTPIFTLTLTASADVAEKRFVLASGAQVGAAGLKAIGVSDYAARSGEPFAAHVVGTAIVEAGAAIPLLAAGMTPVKSDAAGKAIPQAGAGEILGYALQAASAAGARIEIVLAL